MLTPNMFLYARVLMQVDEHASRKPMSFLDVS